MTKSDNAIKHPNKISIRCPYCWTEHYIEIFDDDFEIIITPPITKYSYQFSDAKIPRWMFWAVKFPEGTREKIMRCKNCELDFYVGLISKKFGSGSDVDAKNLRYYLNLVKGNVEVKTKHILLEDILTRICKLFGVNIYLACFLLIFLSCLFLKIIPTILMRGFSKLVHDPIFIFIIFFSIALISLVRHWNILKSTLNCENLPLPLHENYKKSGYCNLLENFLLKGNIFGHPYARISPPTFCGIVSIVIFLIWQILYIHNVATTFYETQYTGFPIIYTSWLLEIIVIPFWAMIYFIVGNIIWFFMATTSCIGLVTRYMPIKIDPLKEMGGTEIFGKIILSSLYPMTLIGAWLPVSIIWSTKLNTYMMLMGISFASFFVFLVAFGFFYPLWPIHNYLKREKEKTINNISEKIPSPLLDKIDENSVSIIALLLLQDKISSMHEWPFKLDALIKAFSSIVLPIISFLVNILLFY